MYRSLEWLLWMSDGNNQWQSLTEHRRFPSSRCCGNWLSHVWHVMTRAQCPCDTRHNFDQVTNICVFQGRWIPELNHKMNESVCLQPNMNCSSESGLSLSQSFLFPSSLASLELVRDSTTCKEKSLFCNLMRIWIVFMEVWKISIHIHKDFLKVTLNWTALSIYFFKIVMN